MFLTGCGDSPQGDAFADSNIEWTEWWGPPEPIAGLSQRMIGEGPEAVILLWSKGHSPPRDAVVFLHAWQPLPPDAYDGWIRHLADRGNTIVYPIYQEEGTPAGDFREGAIAGIEAGLRAIRADPDSVVAIGHITGAALAADYAALAPDFDLPRPKAVFAVYPGRQPPGVGVVASADLSRIPSDTWFEVVAGLGDRLPRGQAEARAMFRGASNVRDGRRIFYEAPSTHPYGPLLEDPVVRRSFWYPADRLIAKARVESGSP